ncbi:hypothetical protein [uncultured Ruthenibacterium sp.]|uniref:hypothetical protein n=1 Tax=uncultured Ruthenibacterium sp. TaxID=1905347 RepID=UPI00349E5BFF
MRISRIALRKLLIGAILLVIAAAITMFIKESLDTQDPESALPILSIEYNGTQIPPSQEGFLYRAGYEWNFFTTVERRAPQLAENDLPLVPLDVSSQAELKLLFSKEPSGLKVLRASGTSSTEFLELTDASDGTFNTPATPGTYVYKILAEWGNRGYIQYYFSLQVR